MMASAIAGSMCGTRFTQNVAHSVLSLALGRYDATFYKTLRRFRALRGLDGEFDPGSGRTLAAYLRHASRTEPLRGLSGGRVRNAYGTYHGDGGQHWETRAKTAYALLGRNEERRSAGEEPALTCAGRASD